MSDEPGRDGRAPDQGGPDALGEAIDAAFDYRGDVTLELADGREIVGYLFNRDSRAREPFVQLFERETDHPLTIAYATIRTIRFTGRDMAAGQSYAAWLRSRQAGPAAGA